MKVFTLTRYKEGGSKFSSATCIFKTFRVGFPTALHIVHDNDSIICDWPRSHRYLSEIGHWKFIENIISTHDEPICFVDPDVIFYGEVESKLRDIKQLVAGRYCPNFWNPVEEANEVERIHTSLLYISDPKALSAKIKFPTCANYSVSPYQGFHFFCQGKKYVYDTFANICHIIPKSDIYQFGPDILDQYTHLISGSMLDYVAPKLKGGDRLIELHKLAETEPNKLRYFWRENETFYKENPPKY